MSRRSILSSFALFALLSCGKAGLSVCPLDQAPPVADAGAGGSGGSGGGGGSGGAGTGGGDAGVVCPTCGNPGACARVQVTAVEHAVGIAASQAHDDVFYMIEAGDVTPRIFMVDRNGRERGRLLIEGIARVGWQDLAVGPCPSGSCLYIGDIGDPTLERTEYAVVRVAEPLSLSAGETMSKGEILRFVYSDGRHDAATLLAHPVSGVLGIVTREQEKGIQAARVYELPKNPLVGSTSTAKKTGELQKPEDFGTVTGGDVQPEGKGILLRAGLGVFYYPMQVEESFGEALSRSPCVVPVLDEEQAEAVAFTRAGNGYLTLGAGQGAGMNFALCAP